MRSPNLLHALSILITRLQAPKFPACLLIHVLTMHQVAYNLLTGCCAAAAQREGSAQWGAAHNAASAVNEAGQPGISQHRHPYRCPCIQPLPAVLLQAPSDPPRHISLPPQNSREWGIQPAWLQPLSCGVHARRAPALHGTFLSELLQCHVLDVRQHCLCACHCSRSAANETGSRWHSSRKLLDSEYGPGLFVHACDAGAPGNVVGTSGPLT